MSAALQARGLTIDQARADMMKIMRAAGSHVAAHKRLGFPSSTWHSAMSGSYGPGPMILDAIYGLQGKTIRPELLKPAGSPEPEQEPEDDAPAPAPVVGGQAVVVAPVCGDEAFDGMTVAELLLRAQRRAVNLENDLDEALGEIESLKAMAARLAREGEQA